MSGKTWTPGSPCCVVNMAARKRDPLGLPSDIPNDWTPEVEQAVGLLEALDAPRWDALRELARAHVTGNISLDAWRAAVGDIVSRLARNVSEM